MDARAGHDAQGSRRRRARRVIGGAAQGTCMRLELSYVFDIPVQEAFTYITEMKNWPQYWPGFVRFADPAAANWSHAGDWVKVVVRLLGRERTIEMELREYERDQLVVYISRQRRLPLIRHERHFTPASPTGCEYRVIIEFEERKGLIGLID